MNSDETPSPIAMGLAVGLFSTSVVLWVLWTRKPLRRWWAWQDGPRLSFGLIDIFSIFCFLLLAEFIALKWLGATGSGGEQASGGGAFDPNRYWVIAACRIAAVIGWGCLTCATRRQQAVRFLAAHRRHFAEDLVRGVIGFALWIPPILIMQGLLARLIPYEHPTTEMLKDLHRWQDVLPLAIVAVIVAPLVEELIFRGALLGWLDRLVAGSETGVEILWWNTADSPYSERGVRGAGSARWLAVIGSSVVFAALHLGNGPEGQPVGPDIVPLFLLALVLGWTTRQTGRLTSAFVIHFLLNAYTVTLLVLGAGAT